MGGVGSGGGFGLGGQGGCEWRSEAFVKIQKKKYFFLGGGVGSGGGRRGRGGGVGLGGVRVDVKGEVSFCENSKKKN